MKKLLIALCISAGCSAFALDHAGWLEKARTCIESGAVMDSDETKEDGLYCLVMAAIDSSKEAGAALGEAQLTATRKLTAFVQGEKVTASREVEKTSSEISVNGEKVVQRSTKFAQKMTTKVDAFMRGAMVIGQVTVEKTSYVVMLATENTQDQSVVLKEMKDKMGDEGVVVSCGEASTLEVAIEKAKRGAVEQVLGAMVVGYDKMSTGEGFSSQVFSGTKGFVDEYRKVSERKLETGVRVEIVAKVSKKSLLDSYGVYLKFLGNPKFIFRCNSPALQSEFTQFMTDLDIQVTENRLEAAYQIDCWGDYRNVSNPMNGKKGVQLSLHFKICDLSNGDVVLDMRNDPRKANCFATVDSDRQKEICSGLAFKQMKDPLHKNINTMVAQMVDRKMSALAK